MGCVILCLYGGSLPAKKVALHMACSCLPLPHPAIHVPSNASRQHLTPDWVQLPCICAFLNALESEQVVSSTWILSPQLEAALCACMCIWVQSLLLTVSQKS
jgi:hypothetical protein